MVDPEKLHIRLVLIPIFKTLRLKLVGIGEGTAKLTLPHEAAYDGIFRSLHGGLLMTLADTSACIAVLTQAGVQAEITTTDMNIRFLSPVDRMQAPRPTSSNSAKHYIPCRLKFAMQKAHPWLWLK